MSNVIPKEGGPYSLFCTECGRWVPNTANHEMRREGAYAHSHSCPEPGQPIPKNSFTDYGVSDEEWKARQQQQRG